MAAKSARDGEKTRMDAESTDQPAPRLRLPLKTLDDVKAELARLYREGKAGTRAVGDVSKLANILGIVGRLIVDHEIAGRVEALEQQQQRRGR